MIFEIIELDEGVTVSGPTGSIDVYAEPVKNEGRVHIGDYRDGDAPDGMLPVTGDTYNQKGKIKKLPYGDDGTKWTGEVWAVAGDKVTDLVAVLKLSGLNVTVHSTALAIDDDWGELQNEVDIDGGGTNDETIKLMVGPRHSAEGVSRSWVEEAAKLGNSDDVDAFIEKYNLDVYDDEELMEKHGFDESDDEVEVFSSENKSPF